MNHSILPRRHGDRGNEKQYKTHGGRSDKNSDGTIYEEDADEAMVHATDT